mmetsp:Transcript_24543/g.73558  ORF Transcript_24543/g.73558 Transcript_24543/m.73558 type:complete len:296 (+) Transcript_24543:973-1860(+)
MVPEEGVHSDAKRRVRRHTRSHSVASVSRVSKLLLGNSVRQLRLVEEDGATVAVPHGEVLFGVFHCQAIRRDVVAINDQAVAARVRVVRDRPAIGVVCPPQPRVVHNDVAAADVKHDLGGHRRRGRAVGAADAGEDVGEDPRGRCGAGVPSRPPLEQRGRSGVLPRAGLQQQSRDADIVDVADRDERVLGRRDERGKAETKKDLALGGHVERGVDLVDAGREHHVQPRRQLGVDGCGRVGRLGHVDRGEVHRGGAGRRKVGRGRIGLERRDLKRELAAAVNGDVRFLGYGWRRRR